jgi:hypothetical protein
MGESPQFAISLDANEAMDQLARAVTDAWAFVGKSQCGAVISVSNGTDVDWEWRWNYKEQGDFICDLGDIPKNTARVWGMKDPGGLDGALGGVLFHGGDGLYAFFGCHIVKVTATNLLCAYLGTQNYQDHRWDALDLLRNQTRQYVNLGSVNYVFKGIKVKGQIQKHLAEKVFFNINITLGR